MNRNQKKSSKISGFFNKLFASIKSKNPSRISARSVAGKRAVFFVLLAFLVLGFSVKSSFAAKPPGDPPPPGANLLNYPEWQKAINNFEDNTNNLRKADLLKITDNGLKMPSNPVYYGGVLKAAGGYSWSETDEAGIKYAKENAFTIGDSHLFLDTQSQDKQILSYWQKGQGVPEPSAATKVLAQSAQGYLNMGNTLTESATSIFFQAIIATLFVITYFLKYFVSLAGGILDITLNPSLYNFTSNQLIVQGWTMVRDVCNLFFLLVLLFIAICTILKIEKYHAKKTLLTLIIMALLINFSKPIAIFVFDGSQLLMNEFLKQMGIGNQQASTMFTSASNIAKMIYDSIPKYVDSADDATLAVQYLFAVVFLFMLLVAYLVIAIMLLIRIVVVMLLIIVSPFAFFAAIVPDFSKMSSQWWSALFEYSYFGPAAAFFLLLATKLSTALPSLVQKPQGNGTQINDLIQNCIYYATTIIFLYASIFMAKKFGGGAGAAVVGNANRVMKWGTGLSKGGGVWGSAARGTAQITGATNMYKGIKSGIAKQPYWRHITKEGREAASKESQERWEGRVAPFNIANVKKKAEERKNDAEADIERDALAGDLAAILVASNRGGSLAARVFANGGVRDTLLRNEHADLRNAAYKNFRDNNQAHLQSGLEAERRITPGMAPGAAANEMNNINQDLFEGASTKALFEERDLGTALATEQGGARGNFLSTNVQHRLARMQSNDARRILTDGKIRGQISQQVLARVASGTLAHTAEANAIIAFARTGHDPFAPVAGGGGGFAVI